MSSTVKNFTINYNPVNEENTFTSGDVVSGQISLEVAKECHIDSLSVKFKGKATVLWSERHGQVTVVYHSKDKYFSITQFIIRLTKGQGRDEGGGLVKDLLEWCIHIANGRQVVTSFQGFDDRAFSQPREMTIKHYCQARMQNLYSDSSVVAAGCHVYPFTFHIPPQDMPNSFDGECGKIVYSLKARLSRSMRIDSKASTKINFVSKAIPNNVPELMTPQHGCKDKKMKFFTSGTVGMDVQISKMGYCQGEGINVVASIQNNSSREIKPKYCIYRKHSFFANGKRRLHTKDLLKEVGEPIPPKTNQTVSRVITIPPDMATSILNCSILKAEYRIRVYLDVKYASDPEIKFPIVILPASPFTAAEQPPAYAGFGFQAAGYPNPLAWNASPQPPMATQPVEHPPPYGMYGMYPPVTDFGKKY
ncbi:arrestin domain-containing protein 3 [Diretmus argenteus]